MIFTDRTFQTLLSREILRFTRVWMQTIVPQLLTSLLYLVVFGIALRPYKADRGHPLPRLHPARHSLDEPDHQLADELILVGLRRQARALHRRGAYQPDERPADHARLLFRRYASRPGDGGRGLRRRDAFRRRKRQQPADARGDRPSRLLRVLLFGHDGRRPCNEGRAHLSHHECHYPAAGVPGRGVLLRRDVAKRAQGGDVLQPDFLYDRRGPLRDAGRLRPEPLPDPWHGLPHRRDLLWGRLVGHKPWPESSILEQQVSISACRADRSVHPSSQGSLGKKGLEK